MWWDERELLVIKSRRLGKTTLNVIFLMILGGYLNGLFSDDEMDALQSDKIDNLIRRWRKQTKRPFNALVFLPGTKQSNDVMEPVVTGAIRDFDDRGWPKYKYVGNEVRLLDKQEHLGKECWTPYKFSYDGIASDGGQAKRGMGADVIVLDEVADIPQQLVSEICRPQLRDSGGFLVSTGTAKSTADMLETRELFLGHPKKHVDQCSIYDARDMGDVTDQFIEDVIDQDHGGDSNDPIFRMEYACDWEAGVKGAILSHWDETRDVPEELHDLHPMRHLVCDLGFGDPYVGIEILTYPTGHMVLRKAIQRMSQTTQEFIDVCWSVWRGNRDQRREHAYFDTVILPSDANAKTTVSRHTDADWFRFSGIGDRVITAKRFATEEISIKLLQEMIHGVYVSPQFPKEILTHFKRATVEYASDGRSRRVMKHDIHSHATDALKYAITTIVTQSDGSLFPRVPLSDRPGSNSQAGFTIFNRNRSLTNAGHETKTIGGLTVICPKRLNTSGIGGQPAPSARETADDPDHADLAPSARE